MEGWREDGGRWWCGGGGCLTAALTQWSDRVRFVFGGFGKSGTVSSSFRQKGKARRSRTAEHDNQLYFMSLYSNLLHPQHLSPALQHHHHHPAQHTQAHFEDGSPWRKNISPFFQSQIGTNWSRGTFLCVSAQHNGQHTVKNGHLELAESIIEPWNLFLYIVSEKVTTEAKLKETPASCLILKIKTFNLIPNMWSFFWRLFGELSRKQPLMWTHCSSKQQSCNRR